MARRDRGPKTGPPWFWAYVSYGARTRLVALMAIVCARAAAGATPCDSPETCLQVIARNQSATRSLSARFRQTKHLSLLTEPLVSTGRFAFQQPDQILWQLDEPRVTVRIDRQGIHLPDLPGAAADAAALAPFSDVMRQLSGLFTGSTSTVESKFVVQAQADDASIRLHLVPRDAQWQRMVRALDVTFLLPAGVVKTMRLDEAIGDHLEIEFSDIHRNDGVADAAFSEKP